MTDIKIEVESKKVQRKLEKVNEFILDQSKAWKRVSVMLDSWVQRNFKSEGALAGGWQPFAQSTLDRMARYDPNRAPAKLLQRTGRLRSSFITKSGKDFALIGSALPYAETHEKGLGHVPARRMIPQAKDVKDDVAEIIEDFVRIAVK